VQNNLEILSVISRNFNYDLTRMVSRNFYMI